MRKNLVASIALFLILFGILSSSPVRAVTFQIGVKAGDFVDYGLVSFSSNSTSPLGFDQFNHVTDVYDIVTSVDAAVGNVTLRQTYSFDNGTASRSVVLQGNVQTGEGNLTQFLIPGGLNAGDLVPVSYSSFTGSISAMINETVTRFYAGAVRTVNLFGIASSFSGLEITSRVYYDQASGFLLEASVSGIIGPPLTTPSYIKLEIKATSTNLWSPTTTGDYALDSLPLSSAFIYQGDSVNFALNATSFHGLTGTATLSTSLATSNSTILHAPVPSLVGSSIGLNSTSLLTIQTDPGTPTGLYLVNVNATSNSITRSVSLVVVVLPPDFSMTADPSSLTIKQGGWTASTITVQSHGGFAGTIAIMANAYGIEATLSNSSVVLKSGSSLHVSLNVTAPSGLAPGDFYFVLVSANNGTLSHNTEVFVTVEAGTGVPGFAIQASPTTVTIPQGSSSFSIVTVSSVNGFSGAVTTAVLYDKHLAVDPSTHVSTLTASGFTSEDAFLLTVSTNSSTPLGNYQLLLTATNGTIFQTATISVNVTTPFKPYLPGVRIGDMATFKPMSVVWHSSLPESPILKDLNNTDHETIQVIDVVGTNVTMHYDQVYKNGTSTQGTIVEDVATGISNSTDAASFASGQMILIASGLSAPDRIAASTFSPELNSTISRNVLGVERTVNILNETSTSVFGTFSDYLAWDQVSGILVRASTYIAFPGSFESYTVEITDTSIWTPAQPAKVTIDSNTPSPSPTDTNTDVRLNFTTTSTTSPVTGITVDWGDGTIDSLQGDATTDTHMYTSTGSAQTKTFQITVTATNSAGQGSATTQETVTDRPPALAIASVTNPAYQGQLVSLAFTASDPDGTISTVTVDWGDNTGPQNLPGTSTSETHTYQAGGQYTITVSATDNSGSRNSETQAITVTPPPTVTVSTVIPNPAATEIPVTVNFQVSGAATGLTIDWGDGTPPDSLPGDATTGTHTYTNTGDMRSQTFKITVTASNPAGPYSKSIDEMVTDQPPTVTVTTVSPTKTDTSQIVAVHFTASDQDGTISAITVNWGDGSNPTTLSGTDDAASHNYMSTDGLKTKTFTINVTATDNSGSASSTTKTVTINDQPPVESITGMTPNPSNTSQTVNLRFSTSDPDGTIQSLKVDWGDGTSDTLQTTATSASHVYNSAKTYTITITATDDAGNTGTTTQTQTVIALPAPVAILGLPPTTFYASLGGIIAIVIIAGALLALRRKPKSSK